MPNLRPTHLVISLTEQPQDARDLHREPKLTCAGCLRGSREVAAWVLPGLCNECALYVEAVTVAAPRVPVPAQQTMFDRGRLPG